MSVPFYFIPRPTEANPVAVFQDGETDKGVATL